MGLRQGCYRFINGAGGKMPETCAKRFEVRHLLLLLWCWWLWCDMGLTRDWYRLTNGAGGRMPETCTKRFEVDHLLLWCWFW